MSYELTDEEIIIDVCGSCSQEERWTDTDCHICKGNMHTAAKIAQAKLLSYYQPDEKLREEVAAIIVGEPSEVVTKDGDYVPDPLYEMDIQNAMPLADSILSLVALHYQAKIEQARKEGREEIKLWLLNHMCHIGRSDRQYVYLGMEFTKQCQKWNEGQTLQEGK